MFVEQKLIVLQNSQLCAVCSGSESGWPSCQKSHRRLQEIFQFRKLCREPKNFQWSPAEFSNALLRKEEHEESC